MGRIMSVYEEDDRIKEEGKRKKKLFETKMKLAVVAMFRK